MQYFLCYTKSLIICYIAEGSKENTNLARWGLR